MAKRTHAPDRPTSVDNKLSVAVKHGRWLWAGIVLLVCVTAAAYWPASRGKFLLDDELLLSENALIKAPDGLYRIWFTSEPVDYWPVTNTALWFEWRLWGSNPAGYHLVNLAFHILNCLLIWLILQRLRIPGAFFAAFLFAVHPVNVESVAWISQQKNTISLLFFLLSLWEFLQSDIDRPSAANAPNQPPARRHYWLSLLAFVLAILSKGSVAVLPLLLLVLIWFYRRQITRRDLARTAPFFIVAAVFVEINIWFQSHGHAIRQIGFAERLTGAGAAIWFYLGKAFLPINLVFVYPQWKIETSELRWWLPLIAALVSSLILLWKRDTWWGQPLLVAWGFFCVALIPVLGFVDVGFMQFSLVADHYLYISLIAVAAFVAAIWMVCFRQLPITGRRIVATMAACLVGILTYLTWQQSQLYSDPLLMCQATMRANPDCWMICNDLGNKLIEAGRPQVAIEPLNQALQLNQNNPEAHYNLGTAFSRLGQKQEALEQFQQALQLKPKYAEVHSELGRLLYQMGMPDDAIQHLTYALDLKSDDPNAENNLGIALKSKGQVQEAISHFRKALDLSPNFSDAHINLGNALFQVHKLEEAAQQYEAAIKLKPDAAEAQNNLGAVLLTLGKIDDAIQHFQQAISLKPDYLDAYCNLGDALSKGNRLPEALAKYQHFLDIEPDNARVLAHFAIALARNNQPTEAKAAAEKALGIAQAHGQVQLAEQLKAWLNSH